MTATTTSALVRNIASWVCAAPCNVEPQRLFWQLTQNPTYAADAATEGPGLLHSVTVLLPELQQWALRHVDPHVQAAYFARGGVPREHKVWAVENHLTAGAAAELLREPEDFSEAQLRTIAETVGLDSDAGMKAWRQRETVPAVVGQVLARRLLAVCDGGPMLAHLADIIDVLGVEEPVNRLGDRLQELNADEQALFQELAEHLHVLRYRDEPEHGWSPEHVEVFNQWDLMFGLNYPASVADAAWALRHAGSTRTLLRAWRNLTAREQDLNVQVAAANPYCTLAVLGDRYSTSLVTSTLLVRELEVLPLWMRETQETFNQTVAQALRVPQVGASWFPVRMRESAAVHGDGDLFDWLSEVPLGDEVGWWWEHLLMSAEGELLPAVVAAAPTRIVVSKSGHVATVAEIVVEHVGSAVADPVSWMLFADLLDTDNRFDQTIAALAAVREDVAY